ncbi:MAG: winged helix DNA-binding domain-containing protein [Actinomycetota bacterium]|nr:winged helix DNA-binding domain-containing protein [Actinomycetota bacterium]
MLGSRLGIYDRADLDDLGSRRVLFTYWAHAASLVLTEDFPIHQRMRRWGRGDSGWERKMRAWVQENRRLRRHVLAELRRRGPLRLRDFKDLGRPSP